MLEKSTKTKTRGRGVGLGLKPSCRGTGNGKANTTAHPEFPDKAVQEVIHMAVKVSKTKDQGRDESSREWTDD